MAFRFRILLRTLLRLRRLVFMVHVSFFFLLRMLAGLKDRNLLILQRITYLISSSVDKLMTELFINDLHRRGEIDAFSLRFPTVSVRAGAPTQAASSFLSGIIREPMNGQECIVPIQDRAYRAVLSGPGTLIENLLRVLKLPSNSLPDHIRWMNFPGITVTLQEMLDALAKVGGQDRLQYVKEEIDPVTEKIIRTWPVRIDDSTATNLGLVRDESAESLVREYVESMGK